MAKQFKKKKGSQKKKQLQSQLKLYSDNLAFSNKQLASSKKIAHSSENKKGKNMSINKNDVILHSSTGVGLHELHHGFKYKSKHQNKKGKGLSDSIKSIEKSANNSISGKSYDKSQTSFDTCADN